jgi:hypothetical protein
MGGVNSLESIFIQKELNKILQLGVEPNKCRMKGAMYNKISIQTVTDMSGFNSTNPHVSWFWRMSEITWVCSFVMVTYILWWHSTVKVKVKLYNMKAYGGCGGVAPSFIISALDGGEWSASCPWHFTLGIEPPSTHCIGGWVGSRAGLDSMEKRKSCPFQESNPSCPLHSLVTYTGWAKLIKIIEHCYIYNFRKYVDVYSTCALQWTAPTSKESCQLS